MDESSTTITENTSYKLNFTSVHEFLIGVIVGCVVDGRDLGAFVRTNLGAKVGDVVDISTGAVDFITFIGAFEGGTVLVVVGAAEGDRVGPTAGIDVGVVFGFSVGIIMG